MQDLDHMHVLVSAALADPPTTVERMTDFLTGIVDAVDMKILMGPYATRCDTEGNEGVTGAVVIETSHITAHCWDTAPVPFVKFDLYSCKRFDPQSARNSLLPFSPYWIEMVTIDRNNSATVKAIEYEQIVSVSALMGNDYDAYCQARLVASNIRNLEQKNLVQKYADLERKYTLCPMKNFSKTLLGKIETNCTAKGLPYDLTIEWLNDAIKLAKESWPKLTLMGNEMSFWSVCIDRIDATMGYTRDNSRIIPYALSVAKGRWNKQELQELTLLTDHLF